MFKTKKYRTNKNGPCTTGNIKQEEWSEGANREHKPCVDGLNEFW